MPLDVLSKIQSFANGGSVDAGTRGAINDMIGNAQQNPALQSGLNGIANAVTNNGADINPDTMAQLAKAGQAFSKAMEQANLALLGIHGSLTSIDVTPLEKAEASLTGIAEHGKGISISIGTKDAESSLSGIASRLEKIRSSASVNVSVSASIPRAQQQQPKPQKFAKGGRVTYHRQNTETAQTGGIFRHGSSTGDRNLIFANRGEGIITARAMAQGARQRGMSPDAYIRALNNPSFNLGMAKKGRSFALGGRVGDEQSRIDSLINSINNVSIVAGDFKSASKKKDLLDAVQGAKEFQSGDAKSEKVYKKLDDLLKMTGGVVTDLDKTDELLKLLKQMSSDVSDIKDIEETAKDREIKQGLDDGSLRGHKMSVPPGMLVGAVANAEKEATTPENKKRYANIKRAVTRTKNSSMAASVFEGQLKQHKNELGGIGSSEELVARMNNGGLSESQLRIIDEISTSMNKLETEIEAAEKKIETFSDAWRHWGETSAYEVKSEITQIPLIGKAFDGNVVGTMAYAAAVAYVGVQFDKLMKATASFVSTQAKLNKNFTVASQSLNTFSGSTQNLQKMSKELNLTREGAVALAKSMQDVALQGVHSVDTVSTIATNLKNTLGAVDTQKLQEAVNLINDLPKEQVDVMINGTGSFDDKANLIANLMNDGKLEKTIDLMMNGAFGDMEGSVELDEKDKAVIESQERANVILDEINKGIYSIIPKGFATTAVKWAGVAGMIGKMLTSLWMVKKVVTNTWETVKAARQVAANTGKQNAPGNNSQGNNVNPDDIKNMTNGNKAPTGGGNGPNINIGGSKIPSGRSFSVKSSMPTSNTISVGSKIPTSPTISVGGNATGAVAKTATSTATSTAGNVAGSVAGSAGGAVAGTAGGVAGGAAAGTAGGAAAAGGAAGMFAMTPAAAAGIGGAIGTAVVGVVAKGLEVAANKRDKKALAEYKENAAHNKAVYGSSVGREALNNSNVAEAERTAAKVATVGAGVAATIATIGVALAPASAGITALGGAAIAAAAAITTGLIAGTIAYAAKVKEVNKDGNAFSHQEKRGWYNPARWFGSNYSREEDSDAKQRKEEYAKAFDKLDEIYQKKNGVDPKQMKQGNFMLKELISLNKHVKAIEMITKGRFTAFDESGHKADMALIQQMSTVGGTDQNFSNAMKRAFAANSRSYSTNVKLMGERKSKIMNDTTMGDEAKANALNKLLDEEAKMHQKFINNMMNVIKAFGEMPKIMVHTLKSEMDTAFNGFLSRGFVGGVGMATADASSNVKNGVQDMMSLIRENGKNNTSIRETVSSLRKNLANYDEEMSALQKETGISSGDEAEAEIGRIQEKFRDVMGGLVDALPAIDAVSEWESKASSTLKAAGSDEDKIDESAVMEMDDQLPEMIEQLEQLKQIALDNNDKSYATALTAQINKMVGVQKSLKGEAPEKSLKERLDVYAKMHEVAVHGKKYQAEAEGKMGDDLERLRQARRYQTLERAKSSAGDPEVLAAKMRAEQAKQFITKIQDVVNRFTTNLDNVLKNGSVEFYNAMKGALEKSEEFDMFGDGNAVLDTLAAGVANVTEQFKAVESAKDVAKEFSLQPTIDENGNVVESEFSQSMDTMIDEYFKGLDESAQAEWGNKTEQEINDNVVRIYEELCAQRDKEAEKEDNKSLGEAMRNFGFNFESWSDSEIKEWGLGNSVEDAQKLTDQEIGARIRQREDRLAAEMAKNKGISEDEARQRVRADMADDFADNSRWVNEDETEGQYLQMMESHDKLLASRKKREPGKTMEQIREEEVKKNEANREKLEKFTKDTGFGREYMGLLKKQAMLRQRIQNSGGHDQEAMQELEAVDKEISDKENTDEFKNLDDDVKTGIKALAAGFAGANQASQKIVEAQANAKQDFMKMYKQIAASLDKMVMQGDNLVLLAKQENLEQQQSFQGEYGDVGTAIGMSGDIVKNAQALKEGQLSKIDESTAAAKAELEKMLEPIKSSDPEKYAKMHAAGLENIEKERWKTLERIYKQMADSIIKAHQPAMEALERQSEGLGIEKDLYETIGAPFEYILDIEQQLVRNAQEKAEEESKILADMEASGIKGAAYEKQKLKVQKASAEVIKASFGAQRDSLDKMLGKMMGTFDQIGGIFGPDSEFMKARKAGQGYTQLPSGMISAAGGSVTGYADRVLGNRNAIMGRGGSSNNYGTGPTNNVTAGNNPANTSSSIGLNPKTVPANTPVTTGTTTASGNASFSGGAVPNQTGASPIGMNPSAGGTGGMSTVARRTGAATYTTVTGDMLNMTPEQRKAMMEAQDARTEAVAQSRSTGAVAGMSSWGATVATSTQNDNSNVKDEGSSGVATTASNPNEAGTQAESDVAGVSMTDKLLAKILTDTHKIIELMGGEVDMEELKHLFDKEAGQGWQTSSSGEIRNNSVGKEGVDDPERLKYLQSLDSTFTGKTTDELTQMRDEEVKKAETASTPEEKQKSMLAINKLNAGIIYDKLNAGLIGKKPVGESTNENVQSQQKPEDENLPTDKAILKYVKLIYEGLFGSGSVQSQNQQGDGKSFFEKMKAYASEAWNAITKFASDKWGEIKTYASEVWTGTKAYASEFWDATKAYASEAWDATKTWASEVWTGTKAYASEFWEGTKEFAAGFWEGTKEVASGFWTWTKEASSGAWDGLKEFGSSIKSGASGLWDGLKEFGSSIKSGASGIWGGIKSVPGKVKGIIGEDNIASITEGFKELFDAIKNSDNAQAIKDTWNGIKAYASEFWDSIKGVATDAWNSVSSYASEVWTGIKAYASEFWDGTKQTVSDAWNSVVGYASEVWTGIKAYASEFWDSTKKVVSDAWNSVTNYASEVWTGIKAYASEAWGWIKSTASSVWDSVTSYASDVWTGIKAYASEFWDATKKTVSDAWNSVTNYASEVWTGIKAYASEAWESIKGTAISAWDSVTSYASDVWTGTKAYVSEFWDSIKGVATSAWDSFSNSASEVWEGTKAYASEAWESVKDMGKSIGSKIYSAYDSFMSGWGLDAEKRQSISDKIGGGVSGAWNNVKSYTSDVWEGTKAYASEAWESVKGWFGFGKKNKEEQGGPAPQQPAPAPAPVGTSQTQAPQTTTPKEPDSVKQPSSEPAPAPAPAPAPVGTPQTPEAGASANPAPSSAPETPQAPEAPSPEAHPAPTASSAPASPAPAPETPAPVGVPQTPVAPESPNATAGEQPTDAVPEPSAPETANPEPESPHEGKPTGQSPAGVPQTAPQNANGSNAPEGESPKAPEAGAPTASATTPSMPEAPAPAGVPQTPATPATTEAPAGTPAASANTSTETQTDVKKEEEKKDTFSGGGIVSQAEKSDPLITYVKKIYEILEKSGGKSGGNAGGGLLSKAWDGIKSVGSMLWDGVKSAGKVAWEGVKSAGKAVWEGTKSLGKKVWGGVKSLFGGSGDEESPKAPEEGESTPQQEAPSIQTTNGVGDQLLQYHNQVGTAGNDGGSTANGVSTMSQISGGIADLLRSTLFGGIGNLIGGGSNGGVGGGGSTEIVVDVRVHFDSKMFTEEVKRIVSQNFNGIVNKPGSSG